MDHRVECNVQKCKTLGISWKNLDNLEYGDEISETVPKA